MSIAKWLSFASSLILAFSIDRGIQRTTGSSNTQYSIHMTYWLTPLRAFLPPPVDGYNQSRYNSQVS